MTILLVGIAPTLADHGKTVARATEYARKAALKVAGMMMSRLNSVATEMKTTSASRNKQDAAKITTLVIEVHRYTVRF